MPAASRAAVPAPAQRARVGPGWIAALVALAAALLYGPSLGKELVYDSETQIASDDFLHEPKNLAAVLTLRVLGEDVLDRNRPTQLLSLMLDARVWGRGAFGYQLTNLLLHAANAALLFLLARVLLREQVPARTQPRADWAAAACALLFAVHPLASEAVCEPSYREDLLVTFFLLLSFHCAAGINPGPGRQRRWRAGGALLALVLAAGAKETGAAGPPLLFLFWLLFRRGAENNRTWAALMVAGTLAVGAFYAASFALAPAQSEIFLHPPQYPDGRFSAAVQVQPRIWAFYVTQIFWPARLCANYGPFSIQGLGLGPALAVLAVFLGAQTWLARGHRAATWAVAWFWLTLLPASNLAPMYVPMADRYLYAPLAGLGLLAATLVARLPWSSPAHTRAGAVALALLAAALAALTLRREAVWHDSLTLWTDTARRNPQSFAAANNLGFALLDAGRYDEAIAAWKRAFELAEGGNADPLAGAALAFEARGDRAAADRAFLVAVKLDPRYRDPDSLARSLDWTRAQSARLRPIAERN